MAETYRFTINSIVSMSNSHTDEWATIDDPPDEKPHVVIDLGDREEHNLTEAQVDLLIEGLAIAKQKLKELNEEK